MCPFLSVLYLFRLTWTLLSPSRARAVMLGAFYPNLLRGSPTSRGAQEEDTRMLTIKKAPDVFRYLSRRG